MFYGREAAIPEPTCTNSSFIFWAPDSLQKDYYIYVHTDFNNDFNAKENLPEFFENVYLVKTIYDPYFRENGTKIFMCEYLNQAGREFYQDLARDLKDRYR